MIARSAPSNHPAVSLSKPLKYGPGGAAAFAADSMCTTSTVIAGRSLIIKKCAPMGTRAVIREEFFFIAGFSVNGDDVVQPNNREATEKWLYSRYAFSAD